MAKINNVAIKTNDVEQLANASAQALTGAAGKQALPPAGDTGSGFAVVGGKRIDYADIGIQGKDPLSGRGSISIVDPVKNTGKVPAIGAITDLQQPNNLPASRTGIADTGSGFAIVDGKKINYGNIGTSADLLSRGTGASTIQSPTGAGVKQVSPISSAINMTGGITGGIGAVQPSAVMSGKTAVPPIGADIGSGFAVVDGKRINYQDIGSTADPLRAGFDRSGNVPGQKSNSTSIIDNLAGHNNPSAISKNGAVPAIDQPIGTGRTAMGSAIAETAQNPGVKIGGIGSDGTVFMDHSGYRNPDDMSRKYAFPGEFNPHPSAKGQGDYNPDGKTLFISPPDSYTTAYQAQADDWNAKYGAGVANLLTTMRDRKAPRFAEAVMVAEKEFGNQLATKSDAAYKKGLVENDSNKIAIGNQLVEAQAKNQTSEANYRDWQRSPAGVATQARTKSGELPADARMVEYLTGNGIAKDPKQAWNMVKTSKSDPVGTISKLVEDMESRQEKLGILPTDPRYQSRESMISSAWNIVQQVQERANGEEQKQPAAVSTRNVSPLRDYLTRNSKRPLNELVSSAQRQGWTDEEIRSAQRPAANPGKARPQQPARQQDANVNKATMNGNAVMFQGKNYPLDSDGTVTIDGRKYRVQP